MAGARLRGQRVARLRTLAGWTQQQLAAELGASGRRRIGQWERGLEQPQPRFVPLLAAALQVEPLELLTVDRRDPPLLALRMAAGLTLTEVAAASGIPYTSYHRLEHGLVVADPAAATAKALARTFGVTNDQILRAVTRSRAEHRPRH